MRFTALERAFTTIDLLIAGASAVMVAAATIYAFSTFTHAAHTQAYNSSAKAAAQTVVDSLERDCGGAIACFVPSNDVGGHSNLDGHEVAMYTRDASGAGKFWSYCYRGSGTTNCSAAAKTGAMNLYGAYAWTDLPQNGGAGPVLDGAIASNILGVTAKSIPASQLLNATANPLTAAVFQTAGYTTIQDVTRQTGYTNVLAGNQVTIVAITTEGLTRTIHIAAGARPTHVDTVIGQVTPSPNALVSIGGGTSLVFANPIAAGQSTGISESNYGTRATTPPQIYALTSSSCSGVTTDTPPGNLNPLGDGTGDATFTVTPVSHVAPTGETCTIVYSDNVGQTASFGITVGATFVPSAQAGAPSYLSGNTVTFTVSEQNYDPIASGGGFTAATSGVCNPPVLAGETMNGTTYIANYTAASSSNGACNFSAVDVYGQSAVAGTSVIQQQLVCNTDPDAGQTIGTIQYVGTTASPPCAPPPTPSPTCPPNSTGTPPNCIPDPPPSPTPAPSPVPVQLYAAFWSAQVCNDEFCDNGQYGIELSDGYMLMSDGSVIGTQGGPLPFQQDCTQTVYLSDWANTVGNPKPLDPGIWSANGVTESGITDMYNNVFNVTSYPPTTISYLNWGNTYDYFADVNNAVGGVPNGVTNLESVSQVADDYLLENCSP